MIKATDMSIFLVVAAAAFAVPGMAEAMSDEKCQRVAEAVCGAKNLKRCISNDTFWSELPTQCHAYVQTNVENEREAREEMQSQASYSCGGILRSRPSMQASKVASVAPGQKFETVEDTGRWTDDYKWFRVSYNGLKGYHWGGIFWTEGGREGTIPSCDG